MTETKDSKGLETPVVKRETFASLNDIKEPGIYVDTRSPRFFRASAEGTTVAGTSPKIRVNEDGLAMGASITNNGSDFTVAKVSTDPMLAKSQVQQLCKDLSLPLPV
ncbi:MAG: hypothetical protein L0196_09480 [candidate division Zixibacteria bacterium]|nr:hypothetical protein [candidate division Zixibacteria bacterium]